MEGVCSSSSPMSSKLVMSEHRPSFPSWEEEWKEDDLDDFDAVKPGGEEGTWVVREDISS